jgi:hypothetical protein
MVDSGRYIGTNLLLPVATSIAPLEKLLSSESVATH